jgi:glycosyltransferase involved in cell wall biosynthesis
MVFCIITHVIHTVENEKFYAYAPYVNEMNIWMNHVDEVIVVAPLSNYPKSPIHSSYNHSEIILVPIKSFDFLSLSAKVKSLFAVFKNSYIIFNAIRKADHIHLRCPGNVGLLGCIIQLFFPSKIKTAKYAGNWDTVAKQPLSYKLQRWILSNAFLTKNMQVLVYGDWPNQSKNVKSFFTATYNEAEKVPVVQKSLDGEIRFVFVGTLSAGKQPIYAIQLVEMLKSKGCNVQLSLYGEGNEKENLVAYINENKLNDFVFLKGNVDKETMKGVYTQSHFLTLPSKSEGWPKVVAEAMFWGCLPIATKVSCISSMLDQGNRGILLSLNLNEDVNSVIELIQSSELYASKIDEAINWSRNYTTDKFENEIKLLLQG